MEGYSSSGLPKNKLILVPFPKTREFDLIVDTINKLLPDSSEAFFCGGTVRDFMMGEEPKDLDLVVTVKDLKIMQDRFTSLLRIEAEKRKIGVSIPKFDSMTLTTGEAKGSILFRMSLELKAEEEGQSNLIQLDFRELKFQDHESMDIGKLLRQDFGTRDFTVNSLYCSTKDRCLIDFKSGFEDLQKKLMVPLRECHIVFSDCRRLVRAIRLSYQHGFKLQDEMQRYIEYKGWKDIRDFKYKNTMYLEYKKILLDERLFPEMFASLSKYGLILNSPKKVLSPQFIWDAFKIISEEPLAQDDKLEELFKTHKTLRPAIVATCALLHPLPNEYSTQHYTVISKPEFYNIFRNFVKMPKYYEKDMGGFGLMNFHSDIQKILKFELEKEHPKLKKLIGEFFKWKLPSSSGAREGELDHFYKRVTPPQKGEIHITRQAEIKDRFNPITELMDAPFFAADDDLSDPLFLSSNEISVSRKQQEVIKPQLIDLKKKEEKVLVFPKEIITAEADKDQDTKTSTDTTKSNTGSNSKISEPPLLKQKTNPEEIKKMVGESQNPYSMTNTSHSFSRYDPKAKSVTNSQVRDYSSKSNSKATLSPGEVMLNPVYFEKVSHDKIPSMLKALTILAELEIPQNFDQSECTSRILEVFGAVHSISQTKNFDDINERIAEFCIKEATNPSGQDNARTSYSDSCFKFLTK